MYGLLGMASCPLAPGGSDGLNFPPPKSRPTPKRISSIRLVSTRIAKLTIGLFVSSLWFNKFFRAGLTVRYFGLAVKTFGPVAWPAPGPPAPGKPPGPVGNGPDP